MACVATEPKGGKARLDNERIKKMLTKEMLEEVKIPMFESPVDGQIYTITLAAQFVANVRDQFLWGLREAAPSAYAALKKQEVAILRGTSKATFADLFANICEAAVDAIPTDGSADHPASRKARHWLTDMVKVLSPEVHAQYHAVKYAEGAATPASRKKSLALVAEFVAKAALVPGF